jgi:hypothetical protein
MPALNEITILAARAKAVSDLNYIFDQVGSGSSATLHNDLILIDFDRDQPDSEKLELTLDHAIDYINALVEKYAK